jgi:hypothetical protein
MSLWLHRARRRLDIRTADGNVVEDVVDLLIREIHPVWHALLFELRKKGRRRWVAGFDYPDEA